MEIVLNYMDVLCRLFWKEYSAKAFGHIDKILGLKEKLTTSLAWVLDCGVLRALYQLLNILGTLEMELHAEDESSQGYNWHTCFWEFQQNNEWLIATQVKHC